jgi:hypothetical protein
LAAPEQALGDLVAAVREDDTLLSEHLREPQAEPVLGLLAAAGPRAAGAEADYAFVVEAVREGYLLHYGAPRILRDVEPDLALLAGDHLYALGLECLAGLGDLEAVAELGDLISLCAALHADGPGDEGTASALWLASACAVAAGASEAHQAAKAGLRAKGPGPGRARALWDAAAAAAAGDGFEKALTQAADSIDFRAPDPPDRG